MERVTLPLSCPSCGGPIEVACEVGEHIAPQRARFICPYCSIPREFDAPGHIVFVAMRQAGSGPETRH